jgi:hypothetical protein
MTSEVTPSYVFDALALQGVEVAPEAPKAIATALTAQLAAASPAYAALAFEAEPANFVAAMAAERP